MRDILVTLIVFGSLPFILKRPYIGVLMWVWLSVMNPHTQGWGFAVSFPFAAIVAGVTMVSLLFTRASKNFPFTPITSVLIAFVLWMNVSTVFAIHPEETFIQWQKVMKIMLMTFVTLMLIKTRQQIHLLVVVVIISLGFYGVKGGIFTIKSGGVDLVWGPLGTFIQGNNELALALIMIIPLMHYLQMIYRNIWIRHGLTVAMLLCAASAFGSHSRGALLAIMAMAAFMWLKSRQKVSLGFLMILAVPVLVTFMPEKWSERMDTINTYEEDGSVKGRFNAWWMAFNLAGDRPLTGGGFEVTTPELFALYAPDILDKPRAAHSIYFQALGEHGFVGLGLYLLLGFLTWKTGSWIIRNTENMSEYRWASNLATMIQVSLVGFSTGGAFLSLLYFDVPYYLMAAMVAIRALVEKELKEKAAPASNEKGTGSQRQFGKLNPSKTAPIARESSK